jgi:hypothetical protein
MRRHHVQSVFVLMVYELKTAESTIGDRSFAISVSLNQFAYSSIQYSNRSVPTRINQLRSEQNSIFLLTCRLMYIKIPLKCNSGCHLLSICQKGLRVANEQFEYVYGRNVGACCG